MHLAISNIAWDVTEDEKIARLLNKHEVRAIEVAPAKYFPDPNVSTKSEIDSVRDWWAARNIGVIALQAIFFGTRGFNVFGSHLIQNTMFNYLASICKVANGLGARYIVFGAPKCRDASGLDKANASNIAIEFFSKLAAIAQMYDVVFCLEPVPEIYGSNFMTTTMDTAHIVSMVNNPAIQMQLDTGALTVNNEVASSIIPDFLHIIGHVHISEPALAPLGSAATNHANIASVLDVYFPNKYASIEMLASEGGVCVESIERSIQIASYYYSNKSKGIINL